MTRQEIKKLSKEVGARLARRLFDARGNHSEAHVNEAELAAIVSAGAEVAIEVALKREELR